MVEREVRDIQTSLLVSIVLSSLFILLASSNCNYYQLLIESVLYASSKNLAIFVKKTPHPGRARVYGRPTEPGDEV